MAEPTAAATRRWRLLLVPQPPLLLAYLFAVREDVLEPSFVPVVVVSLLPALAVVWAACGRAGWLLVAALVEVVWGVLAAAMIGFAIAWRMG